MDELSCDFSYNTDEVQMAWTPSGVSKMRDKMELADYELVDIKNIRKEEVSENFVSKSLVHQFFNNYAKNRGNFLTAVCSL